MKPVTSLPRLWVWWVLWVPFRALTLLDEEEEGHPVCKITCGNPQRFSSIASDRHLFNGIFSMTTWIRTKFHQTSFIMQEMVGDNGIRWTICKSLALCLRQITMPAPHHSVFTGRTLFLTPNQQCQNTEGNLFHSKWRKKKSKMAIKTEMMWFLSSNHLAVWNMHFSDVYRVRQNKVAP